ncbi:MAG: DUF2141 domain-containing protein [Prolixibacteraceae bacterium]|nr:DUF2141 domain-containing protein [Prolixibacteraceae bacterium]
MKRKESCKVLLLLLLASVFQVGAQNNTSSITGTLYNIERSGKVYIFLVDEKNFSIPQSGIDTLILDASSNTMNFSFANVQKGIYGIRCFQDTNGNKILDKGIFGPAEPWGFSWKRKKKYPFGFSDIAFEVYSNLNIEIFFNTKKQP